MSLRVPMFRDPHGRFVKKKPLLHVLTPLEIDCNQTWPRKSALERAIDVCLRPTPLWDRLTGKQCFSHDHFKDLRHGEG